MYKAKVKWNGDHYFACEEVKGSKIEKREGGMESFDSNREEHNNETILVYECTDFDGGSHRIMKLVEKEIN